MKLALVVTSLVFLFGCDQNQPMKCDYCHLMRDDVKRYACDKCKASHLTCGVEDNILHYEDHVGVRGFVDKVPKYVVICPIPEDPPKTEQAPTPPTDRPIRRLNAIECLVVGTLILLMFFLGYAKGRSDEQKRSFGKTL